MLKQKNEHGGNKYWQILSATITILYLRHKYFSYDLLKWACWTVLTSAAKSQTGSLSSSVSPVLSAQSQSHYLCCPLQSVSSMDKNYIIIIIIISISSSCSSSGINLSVQQL